MSGLKIFIYPNLFLQENWGVTTDSVGVATTDHGLVTAANTDHEDFGLVTDIADSGTEGSLSFGASLAESRAFSYNIDSIDVFGGYENYGLLTDSPPYEDLGSITVPRVYDDLGIVQDAPVYPYGTINISGALDLEDQPRVFSHEASGQIDISGAATFEAITKVEEDKTLLGTFTGTAPESFVPQTYTGSGSFSAFGSKVESRGYSYNLGSIQVIDPSEDYGSVADGIITSSEDYGSYLGAGLSSYGDYGNIFSTPDTLKPFGTITISGSVEVETVQPQIHNGSGGIIISGAATFEAITKVEEDKTLLGTFSGGNQYSDINSYVGSGSIGIFSGTADVVGWNPPDQTVDITISGSLLEKNIDSYAGLGEIVISGAATFEAITKVEEDKTLLGTFSGGNQYSDINSYVGLGTLFAVSGGVESRTYDYNIDSIDVFGGYTNYGLITDSPPYEDLGLITIPLVYDDLGIVQDAPVYPYGTINISGAISDEQRVFSHEASGEIVISGIASAVEKKTSTDDETLLGTFSGTSDPVIFQNGGYTGSGSFSAFGSKVESRSYSYNLGSINVIQSPEDYGSVSDGIITSSEDYGSYLGAGLSSYGDYGNLFSTPDTLTPYGTIVISGSVEVETVQPQIHNGSGTITISGIASAVEKKTSADNEALLGTFSGGNQYSDINSYVGSGSFSAFGSKVESRTYDYNIDSIDTFGGYENYGLLTDSPPYEDLGLITIPLVYDDLGIVQDAPVYPYGTINISGALDLDEQIRSFSHEASGQISISGAATFEKKTSADDETLLGTFSGDGVYKEISSYVGSGSVGIFSGLSESVTYDYNLDSIVLIASIEDYGSVGVSTTTSLDYGTLTSPTVPTEDYGYIVGGGTYPYGTINISGALDLEDQPRVFSHEASGEIIISGAATFEKKTSADNETLLGTFSGGNQYSNISSYVGLGTLFAVSGGVESRTYDYNIDSIDVFGGYENYGLLTDSPPYEDLGSITVPLVYDDLGIVQDAPVYPYGTINISGAVSDEQRIFVHEASGEIVIGGAASFEAITKVEEDKTLLGTFSGTAPESFQPTSYIGSGLFSAFGSKVESRGYSYNLGSIQVIDPSEDYGSVADGTITSSEDYGSYLGAGLSSYGDYGNLSSTQENVTPYGTIVISGAVSGIQLIYAHEGTGSIGIFSGTADAVGWNPPDQTVDITISGQAETAVEAEYIPDPGIGTIYIDGTLVERRTYSYNINSTSITYESQDNGLISNSPDSTEIEGGSIASLPTEGGIDYGVITVDGTRLPYGTIRISGAVSDIQNVYAHEGSGTVGIFSGTADAVGWNPPDQTVDISISGDALTAVEAEYLVSGIGTVNVSGFATDERRSFSHVGRGQIDIGLFAEVKSNIPSPTGGVLEFFGRAGEVFSPTTYVGTGTVFASDNGLESRTYIYNETSINGYTTEDNGFIIDPATYEDRGVLSDVVIYEDYGYVVDDGTTYPFDGVIEISGSASVRVDSEFVYDGSGTIGIGGTANPIFFKPNYNGSGTITVSGSAQEAKTPATYIGVGTGQFSAITGSAEVVGWNPPDQTVNITISGVGSEKFTTLQTYSGIGTISIGGTANPVFYTPNYPGSGVISIGGSANPVHYVPNYPGIGTIFAITGAAEAYGAKPPIVPSDIIISGIGSEAYAPAGYTGIGTIVISGAGIGVSNPYRAPFVFVTII